MFIKNNNLFSNKKSVVTLAAFSLVILLLISILAFSYYYYDSSKSDYEEKLIGLDVLNSLSNFRDSLIPVISTVNSTLAYEDPIAYENLQILVDNTSIVGIYKSNSYYINKSISTFGVEFCSNYSFYPSIGVIISYNMSCISIS